MGKEINVYVFLSTSVTWSFGPLGRLSDQVGHEGVCISAVSATHAVYASVPHPCPSLLPLTVTSVIVAFAVFLDPNPVVQPTVFTQRTDSEGAWCVLYHPVLGRCTGIVLGCSEPMSSTMFRIIPIIIVL